MRWESEKSATDNELKDSQFCDNWDIFAFLGEAIAFLDTTSLITKIALQHSLYIRSDHCNYLTVKPDLGIFPANQLMLMLSDGVISDIWLSGWLLMILQNWFVVSCFWLMDFISIILSIERVLPYLDGDWNSKLACAWKNVVLNHVLGNNSLCLFIFLFYFN